MRIDNFVRIIAMFDLPTITSADQRRYRKFVKFLTNEGYLRIQFSIYSKICINSKSASTYSKRLINNSPSEGDIRYMIVSEKQYQDIVNVNNNYSLQEKITTPDRMMMIGGMNDDSKRK